MGRGPRVRNYLRTRSMWEWRLPHRLWLGSRVSSRERKCSSLTVGVEIRSTHWTEARSTAWGLEQTRRARKNDGLNKETGAKITVQIISVRIYYGVEASDSGRRLQVLPPPSSTPPLQNAPLFIFAKSTMHAYGPDSDRE